MYHCASAAALLASASERKSPALVSSALLSSQQREAFTEYKLIIPHMGDSVKAENGSFEIVGEGNVVQKYQVNGKE